MSALIKMYVDYIQRGLWTIEKVPAQFGWREQVQAELDKLNTTEEQSEQVVLFNLERMVVKNDDN